MAALITEEEKRELRKNFDLFDDSNTVDFLKPPGRVLASRIGLMVRGCGENPTQARVDEIVKKANEGDGTMSFEQFISVMQSIRTQDKRLSAADLEGAFRVFDPEKKGRIHQDELRRVLTTLGEKLSEEEAEGFFSIVDTAPDGTVDYIALSKKLIP